MPFISDRSIMSPSSHTAVPATLWPPPRTETNRPWVAAKRTASSTSAVPAQRAMRHGRLSIIAFQIRRAASYPSSPAARRGPRIRARRSSTAVVSSARFVPSRVIMSIRMKISSEPLPPCTPSARFSWGGCSSSHSGQLRLEAVEVLFVRVHGKPLDLVAFGGRLEEHAKGEPGLAGKLREGRRDLKRGTGDVLEDNPLGLYDLHKDALVLIVGAVGTVHDEPPYPARPHVELLKRARKALRSPPAREMIRVGPRLEHVLARPVEDTRSDDLPICGRLRRPA